MQKLTSSLFRLDLEVANAYLIRGKNALMLVDAGIQRSLPRIERLLKKGGFAWRDLTHLFFTHAHLDHVGNLPEIVRLSGAEVWAHRLEAPILRGQQPVLLPEPKSVRPIDRWMEAVVRRYINEDQATGPVHKELEGVEHLSHLLPDLRLVHLPGHAPGHTGLYNKAEGWLIGGDVMMHLTPQLTFPMAAFTPDPQTAWGSILRVANLEPHILALGHGSPLIGTKTALERIASRAKQVLQHS